MATNFSKELIVSPAKKVNLADYDPEETLGWDKGQAMKASLKRTLKKLDSLQYLMYAEKKRALLVVLQALDAGGKDGTIRHVMSGLNPQGCSVTAFKKPSEKELAHDFLWRVHKAVPEYGDIGIFNRSHYEDVLVVRVHNLVSKDVLVQTIRSDQCIRVPSSPEPRKDSQILPAHQQGRTKSKIYEAAG